jgi:hypothetical protein
MLTPATVGVLVASAAAGRLARRRPQRWLIIAGFAVPLAGMLLLLTLGTALVGSVLVVAGHPFGAAAGLLAVIAAIGLVLAVLMPRRQASAGAGGNTPG